VTDLLAAGVSIETQRVTKTSGPLTGKKIVFTGTLATLSREEIKEKIRQAGGDWVSSVSQNTDYVVVGDNPGSKYQKAQTLGVKILDEKEFLKMIQ
ncbi:MAG TPA: BRCT domain-containing protein, partial [Negativicutes bacterium]|nr:BRCT domain-containing protein [Negativicutes bacterium]